MHTKTIALFGEAEKGDYQTAYYLQTLTQLVEFLGNPPPHSYGVYFAVQALFYHYSLLFFRVKEEGFSYHDYINGLQLLEAQALMDPVSALCIPGVGDTKIIEAMIPYCQQHHSIIIAREADLYDYLTERC